MSRCPDDDLIECDANELLDESWLWSGELFSLTVAAKESNVPDKRCYVAMAFNDGGEGDGVSNGDFKFGIKVKVESFPTGIAVPAPTSVRSSSPEAAAQQALEQTNLRVCPETLEVVSVVPFPDASSPWAPKKLCMAAAP